MRVLSVDYDYFFHADETAIPFLPDGGSEFDGLMDVVWSNNYAGSRLRDDVLIKGTHIDTESLSAVKEIIDRNQSARYMISDSHKYAYGFILVETEYGEKSDIWHIDFHHDVYPRGNEVHCGNWLGKLIENGHTESVHWIGREDSDRSSMSCPLPAADMAELPDTFDLIFICRSGWWTPPHLDSYFVDSLAMPVINGKRRVKYEAGINSSRYSQAFRSTVDELAEVYRRVPKEAFHAHH